MNSFVRFGQYLIMLGSLFSKSEKRSMYWHETLRQMNDIGVGSLPIVAIIATFIGAVTALQTGYQMLSSFVPKYYVGFIVRDSMLLELGPTICSLILAGKVGSNIATELGTMRISEQIDALDVMGINSRAYLIRPKLIAALIVIPMLIIIGVFLGCYGGYLACSISGFMTPSEFTRGLREFFEPYNVYIMLVKSLVFAFIMTTVSCFHGYYASGGALEIGKASTAAVVQSCICIIISDYLLATILL